MKTLLWVSLTTIGFMNLTCGRGLADVACPPPCPAPTTGLLERTVLVPQMTTETRRICVIECRPEVRTKKIRVCRMVEEIKEVQYDYCEWRPETRTRQETYQVLVPEWKDVTTEVTVMVPRIERRRGVRKVARCVATTEKRTVCEAGGHWEDRPVQIQTFVRVCDPCGRPICCPQVTTCTQKVWVPEVVQKEIDVTVHKIVCEDQPYEYDVTVCRPETRTCTQRVCTTRCETKTRDVPFTICVPERKTGTRQVVCCRPVWEEKEVQCTVMVPHRVEKDVQVCVCRMVEKKVQVASCCAQPCASAPSCCPTPSHRCCQPVLACCTPAASCYGILPGCCH